MEKNIKYNDYSRNKLLSRIGRRKSWKAYRYASGGVSGAAIVGITDGNIGIANTTNGYAKMGALRGSGFAAEYANTAHDRLHGRNGMIVGDNNAKNGADRLVNGQFIQTKYCKTGANCIQACFENNKFRYIENDTGKPMQIEVPHDEKIYNDAVNAMEWKIKQGQVPGINNPAEAKNIVKRGEYTYIQVENIAKVGNLESLKFDAKTGAYVASFAGGISFIITFIVAINNEVSRSDALKAATLVGVKVVGSSFVTSVIISQMSRKGIPAVMSNCGKYAAKQLGPKACAEIANTFRIGAPNIYGAAARNNAGKMLGNNMFIASISILVISAKDAVDMFRKRISGKQLFKNIFLNGAQVGGGMVGAASGGELGAEIGKAITENVKGPIGFVIKGAFIVVGIIFGSWFVGSGANNIAKEGLDFFIEDDLVSLIAIIEERFASFADDYLVSQTEANNIIEGIKKELDGDKLKDMHASKEQHNFADNLLTPLFEGVVKLRASVDLPGDEEIINVIKDYYDGGGVKLNNLN